MFVMTRPARRVGHLKNLLPQAKRNLLFSPVEGGKMAESSSAGDIAKTIGDLIASFVPEGPLRTAIVVFYGVSLAMASFIFAHYVMLLAHGGAEQGSIERQDYDKLRADLAEDNFPARLFVLPARLFHRISTGSSIGIR